MSITPSHPYDIGADLRRHGAASKFNVVSAEKGSNKGHRPTSDRSVFVRGGMMSLITSKILPKIVGSNS